MLRSQAMAARWMVLREGSRLRWGGDLRRHHILAALAARSDAIDVDGWSPRLLHETLAQNRRRPWEAKPRLAAATMLAPDALGEAVQRAVPFVVDFHDDPVAQNAALGVEMDEAWLERTTDRKRRNLDAFRWLVVPSSELAALAGLDSGRTIVAGNGSDTTVIVPTPWPSEPALGYISGAAPGRGIETLIEAARLVRESVPGLRLLLWLAVTGEGGEAYLAGLRQATAHDAWIEYGGAQYQEIGSELGRATVLCIPNPPSDYWDAVSPVKLFDCLAAGRPVVVTPRTVMRSDVQRHDAGLVAPGDTAEDIATSIDRLMGDQPLARRLGANGRDAAVREHDWRRISERLAAELLRLAG
jgi:glycosyltransferase involved in cell wall biosynthesis